MADNGHGKIEAQGEIYLYEKFWDRLKGSISTPALYQKLGDILKKAPELDWYDVRTYKLDEARDNEQITEFPSAGNCILTLSITSGASAEIKFNSPNAPGFELSTYRKLEHNFDTLYLTNTAQAGKTLKLLFARGDWDVERKYPEEQIYTV